ncbi:MAG TPA: acetamidase/formamidase family protein [Planctomycetaceae bacterium]|nr:acetamidase/formamidase family protein [Planctomycetaceae bacterium]
MATHSIELAPSTLRGYFARDLAPVVTIDSGDSVRCQTLDAGWGALRQADPFAPSVAFEPRDTARDFAHALTGPIAVRGARPGMTLEIRFRTIRLSNWGWSAGEALPSQFDPRLGLGSGSGGPPPVITVPTGDQAMLWALDPDKQLARTQSGLTIATRPFLGVVGMPSDEPGIQSTFPPRFCGGNMDCRELIEGSSLFLPVAVEGGLLSLGDGHAAQGDGEVAGPALACPMERVEVEIHLHRDLHLSMPRAQTPIGWLTFGFHTDVNEAWAQATEDMVRLMSELYDLSAKSALSLASLVVNLRITQVVNGVRGVHAVLPHGAIGGTKSETRS